MRFIAILALLFGSLNQSNAATHWDLNDVSVLLPLGSSLSAPGVLRPETQAASGALLAQKYLSLLPNLSESSLTIPNSSLAVVGVRLDPCFPGVANPPEPCHFQVRLIWQPQGQVGTSLTTLDAAVHTFYELSAQEFADLTAKIAALNAKSGVSMQGLTLGVHPLIAKQGLSGPYWHELSALLLGYIGEAKMVRFTFMAEVTAEKMWDFGGFDLAGGKITRMVIPRVLTREQSFTNALDFHPGFSGGEKPEAPGEIDTFNRIVSSSQDLTMADASVLKSSVEAIYRIENPTIHSPETIDCASCHATESARLWATSVFSDLHLDQSPYMFQSPLYNLQNTTEEAFTPKVLRSFGYIGSTPAINQRVINESAAVAAALSKAK